MSKKFFVLLLLTASLASAQTTVLLNTGYDHAALAPYPASAPQDDYWVVIASYPVSTVNPPAGASWNLTNPGWQPALPNSRWINVNPTSGSGAGVTFSRPGYTIYRKCFCLLSGFRDAQIVVNARADDTLQMWLNRLQFPIIPASDGHYFDPTPLAGSTREGFRNGVNCVYALVEDFTGLTGFNLAGNVTAVGLQLLPATGLNQEFRCPCEQVGPNVTPMREIEGDILEYAEERRLARQRLPRLP